MTVSLSGFQVGGVRLGWVSTRGTIHQDSSNRDERHVLDLPGKAVEHFVDFAPALQLLHGVDPAVDVRILGEIATGQLAEREQTDPEIVSDGDRVTAQVVALTNDVIVQDL